MPVHAKLASFLLFVSSPALAQAPVKPPPTDAECAALPAPTTPFAFGPGEVLDFTLDAMGAEAGKMTLRVLPSKDGNLPVEVRAQTNSFFSKIRRVKGVATSYLSQRTLRPNRYVEESTEDQVHRTADVAFRAKDRSVHLKYTINSRSGQSRFNYLHDGLDVLGGFYAMRQLPLREGLNVCFDAYGIRRMWRVSGKIEAKEQVTTSLGFFEAWHLAGEAVRLDDPRMRREIHVWISADDRRLPLAAVGTIDLGAVRATLTAYSQPGGKKERAQGKGSLKW